MGERGIVEPLTLILLCMRPLFELIDYFLRVVALTHMSVKPAFASLSGNLLMDSMALSEYSCARARVCSRPSDRVTMSRAYLIL